MSFIKKPDKEVHKAQERKFAGNASISTFYTPKPRGRITNARMKRANNWPKDRLDYDFLERCKELKLRIIHPNKYLQHRDVEYRLAVMYWSRGAYIDIRKYCGGRGAAEGILLHQDIWKVLLPELIAALREVEMVDTRDPETVWPIETIPS